MLPDLASETGGVPFGVTAGGAAATEGVEAGSEGVAGAEGWATLVPTAGTTTGVPADDAEGVTADGATGAEVFPIVSVLEFGAKEIEGEETTLGAVMDESTEAGLAAARGGI